MKTFSRLLVSRRLCTCCFPALFDVVIPALLIVVSQRTDILMISIEHNTQQSSLPTGTMSKEKAVFHIDCIFFVVTLSLPRQVPRLLLSVASALIRATWYHVSVLLFCSSCRCQQSFSSIEGASTRHTTTQPCCCQANHVSSQSVRSILVESCKSYLLFDVHLA